MTADETSPAMDGSAVDELEAAVDEAIEACGGNPRDAVRALLVAVRFLEDKARRLEESVSHGYVRRAPPQRAKAGKPA